MEKPAEMAPPASTWRAKMPHHHLYFLTLMLVVVIIKVKIIIRKR
jgi:hypothetical protein